MIIRVEIGTQQKLRSNWLKEFDLFIHPDMTGFPICTPVSAFFVNQEIALQPCLSQAIGISRDERSSPLRIAILRAQAGWLCKPQIS